MSAGRMVVGIFAPSSKVPAAEFELGLQRIRDAGLEPLVHPDTLSGHLFFAGTDEQRARALWDLAQDPRAQVLWCARGGYGAMRILPLLDALTRRHGPPRRKKLLVGFSDATALLEYVRVHWGWRALHAPMPGLRQFCLLPDEEWIPLVRLLRGEAVKLPWEGRKLRFFGSPPRKSVVAPLVGGNLSVWASLVGTPYAGQLKGKILFLEDVDENLYRVDRLVQQLVLSDCLRGARAVVLGNFLNCRDLVPRVLAYAPAGGDPAARERLIRAPEPAELVPLRPSMDESHALAAIFGEIAHQYKIPVAYGLPVGHGPQKAALPLGVRYELKPSGVFKRGSPPS